MRIFLIIFCILLICVIVLRFSYSFIKQIIKIENEADKHFEKNTWENNYMIGLLNYNENKEQSFEQYIENVKKRQEDWENNIYWKINDNICGIIEINKKSSLKKIFNSFEKTTPPKINGKLLPYKIIFLKREKKIVLLLNHYYCDGIILHDIIIHNLLNTKKTINFFKYKYIPVFSDIMLLNYIRKSALYMVTNNHKYLELSNNKSVIVSKTIKYENKINRWIVFSKIVNILFKYTNTTNLSIAITVGFDDNTFVCKNRIGIIIINIPKMNTEYEYMEYIKKEIEKNKQDAFYSYDLIRNFPISYIRKYLDKKIDVILTSLKIDGHDKNFCDLKYLNYDLGSFIGIGKIPLYVFSMTLDYEKTIKICIKSTTPDFDEKKMCKEEPNTKKIYKWKK